MIDASLAYSRSPVMIDLVVRMIRVRTVSGLPSRAILLVAMRGVSAQTGTRESPLCPRMEVLGDAVDQLLTLQLHLERLRRVRHDEGIRGARLPQIPRCDLRPFSVERIRRSGPTCLVHRRRS